MSERQISCKPKKTFSHCAKIIIWCRWWASVTPAFQLRKPLSIIFRSILIVRFYVTFGMFCGICRICRICVNRWFFLMIRRWNERQIYSNDSNDELTFNVLRGNDRKMFFFFSFPFILMDSKRFFIFLFRFVSQLWGFCRPHPQK